MHQSHMHVTAHTPHTHHTHHTPRTQSTQSTLKGRIAKWVYHLMSFNFVVEHRPGRHHGNADALSRLAHLNDTTYFESPEASRPLYEPVPTAVSLRSGRDTASGGERSDEIRFYYSSPYLGS